MARLKSTSLEVKTKGESHPIWLLSAAVVLSLILWNVPIFNWVLLPINVFVTTLHEMSHAIACLVTGGEVTGLTIVPDSQGHAGLTFCSGGIPFIYTQAGYLGTAIFGCVFLLLGRSQAMSQFMLFVMGCLIGLTSLFLMTGTIFSEGGLFQGIGSVIWGLAMAGALIWSALNLRAQTAQLLFLFLAVQTALNSVTSAVGLLMSSIGFAGNNVWSDATNMQKLTSIPAPVWSLLWAGISIVMVLGTLWFVYARPRKEEIL